MTSASKVRIKHVLSGSSQPNSRYRLDRADGRQAHRVVEEIRPRRELDRDDLRLRIAVNQPPKHPSSPYRQKKKKADTQR